MKTNLINVFAWKQVVWFHRMKEMKTRLNWLGFIIALPFMLAGQLGFVFMSFSLEVFLYIFNRNKFKKNLNTMAVKVNEQLRNLEFNKANRLITVS